MSKTKWSGKLWPIHFKPENDELLSSWITRLAIAHGLSLSSFLSAVIPKESNPYRVLYLDIDKIVPTNLLNLLVSKTGTPSSRIISTTLVGYEGLLCEKLNASGRTRWILPVTGGPIQGMHGLQYCPQCLSEDEEPFFRRSWRLAFNVICIKHRIELSDRCLSCDKAVDFRKGFRSIRRQVPLGSITRCFSCYRDIREWSSTVLSRNASLEEIEFQKFLVETTKLGRVEGTRTIYTYLYFTVLRRLIKALSHKSKDAEFRKKLSYATGLEIFSITCPNKTNGIEELRVCDRRRLLNTARWLLTDWPERYINFCKVSNLGSSIL